MFVDRRSSESFPILTFPMEKRSTFKNITHHEFLTKYSNRLAVQQVSKHYKVKLDLDGLRKARYPRITKTRRDKRATAVEGNPKAPFSLASTVTYGINRNSRQGGAPLLSRCVHNLSPVILVLILPTTNGWKAE